MDESQKKESNRSDQSNRHNIPVRRPGGETTRPVAPTAVSQNIQKTTDSKARPSPAQSGHTHPVHPQPNPFNKHSKFDKIKKSSKKLATVVTVYTKKIFKFLKPFIKKTLKQLKKLPWKVIGIAILITTVIFSLLFHVYLASTSRITGVFEVNYDTADVIEKQIRLTEISLSKMSIGNSDVTDASDQLNTLTDLSASKSLTNPPRIFSNYAFRQYDETDKQLEVIYADNSNSLKKLSSESESIAYLFSTTSELFSKNIEQDTVSYIKFLDDSIIKITDIQKTNGSIDTTTLLRIYRQIKESAEQYQVTGDLSKYNSQYQNVSSEIYKEIVKIWDATIGGPQREWISAQRSSYSSILNTVNPEN